MGDPAPVWRRVPPVSDPLVRNGAALVVTTAVNGALGYVYWLVVARSLPVAGVGTLTALVAALTVGSLIAGLGVGPALVQVLPRLPNGPSWRATVLVASAVAALAGALAGGVAAGVLLVTGRGLTVGSSLLVVLLVVVGTAGWTLATTLDQVFVAERRASLVFVRYAVFALAKLGLLFVAQVATTATTDVALLTWVAAIAVSVVVSVSILLPLVDRGAPVGPSEVRTAFTRLRRPAAGNYLITLGGQLSAYGLPLVVVSRADAAVNGFFSVAWMAVLLLNSVSPAVAQALVAEGAHGRDLRAATRAGVQVTALVVLPGALLLIVVRGPLLSLFGSEYAAASAGLLVLLAVATIPDACSNLMVSVARVRHRYRPAVLVNGCIAVGSLVLTWFWLPPLGVAGVGWAWLGAQVLGASIALRVLPSLLVDTREE